MIFRFVKSAARMPLILFFVILPLQATVQADEAEIKIAGGSTALGSMQMLATAFQELHPGMRVRIFPGVGSSGGFNAAAAGAADIGLMGKPLRDTELTMDLSSIEYARTPLAFIAGAGVDVSDVTSEDVVKIYRGETKRWPSGEHIRLILYSASDTDTLLQKKISPGMSKAVDMAIARPGMIFATSTQDGYDKVKQVPGSLGFCSLTKVLTENGSIKILSYNGVLPSVQNLKNRSYPLFKSLYMVVRSTKGQRILEKAGDMAITRAGDGSRSPSDREGSTSTENVLTAIRSGKRNPFCPQITQIYADKGFILGF